MKILYVSQFFKPEMVAAAFRVYENARIWSMDFLDEVTILTGYPNFPSGKLFEGYKIKLLSEEKVENIKVLRSKIFIGKKNNKLNKILNSISFLVFGVINLLFNKKKIGGDYDVVIGTSGTILAPIIAYVYSIMNNVDFVFELRDITYIQLLAVYKDEKKLMYKLVKMIELFLCKKAKKVIVVTAGFKKELKKAGISAEKINIIYNGVSIDTLEVNKHIKNKKIVFSYIGNIGKSQNVLAIIKLISSLELKSYETEVLVIGDGADKKNLQEYIKSENIKNVIIKESMSGEKLEKYYDKTDFSIVSLNNNENFKYTVPSKIFQIWGRGKNIIYFGPKGEAAEIIEIVTDEFIFVEKNLSELKLKIEEKINKKDIKKYLEEIGVKSRKIVELDFDRKNLAEKYRRIIKV